MGELLLAGLKKTLYLPFLCFFSLSSRQFSCLNCFPLSGPRVMKTVKWIPGSESGEGGFSGPGLQGCGAC